MEISIKDLGSCRKELAVIVPADEVAAELEKAYEGVRDQVSIPGFRQGKVPKSLIEKRFGRELKADVANELVGKAVEQAVKEHQLELVSDPEVAAPPSPPESGQSLEFTFQVEVKPTFELPDYKGLEVTRKKRPVTDDDVNAVIEDMRRQKAVLKPVADGFAGGDWLLASMTVRDGDEVVETHDNVPIGGERPRIRGYETEGLAQALAGRKPGDRFSCDATKRGHSHHEHAHHGHHEHEHEEHAHDEEPRAVRLDFEVRDVKRHELPEVDDAFAREVGEETLLGMRVSVRKRLLAAREHESEKEVEQALLDRLVDRASFEMARGPVDRALASRLERLVIERMIRGEDEGSARASVEADRDRVRQTVERDAKAWLIVEKLAKKEKIFALEDDVAKEIARVAEEQGTTPTKVREAYEAEGMLPELRANILERKVLDFLRKHGKVTDATEEAAAGGAPGGGQEA